MNREELKEYKRLDNMFFEECMNVCWSLTEKNPTFKHMADFYLDREGIVHCDGYDVDANQYVSDTFDSKYLFMNHDEILKDYEEN